MRLLIPTLCGVALLAGTVQASAGERRGHMGNHVRSGAFERHVGPRVSVRVNDRGWGGHRGGYYGYGPSYGYSSYGYGSPYGYTSYYGYGPSYGYSSVRVYSGHGYRDDDYGYGYVSTRRDDDDCD